MSGAVKHKLVASALLFAISAFARGHSIQYWSLGGFEKVVGGEVGIQFKTELRFGENVPNLYYSSAALGLSFSLTDYLDLKVDYSQVYERSDYRWRRECRPHVSMVVKVRCAGFCLKERSRLERRIWEFRGDAFRYRNKLSVEFPLGWAQFGLRLFLSDELFVDFNRRGFNQNRLQVGLQAKSGRCLKGRIFYLHWHKWDAAEKDGSVIGNDLILVF